jgi:hypothetical protein
MVVVSFHGFYDFWKAACDMFIPALQMGQETIAAILNPFFIVGETAATDFPQHIQGAVAKQAIEAVPICVCVAGEKPAGAVGKMRV